MQVKEGKLDTVFIKEDSIPTTNSKNSEIHICKTNKK